MSAVPTFRDRVRELRRVRAGDLAPAPKNWRSHPPEQRRALESILREVGFAGALLARELPDSGLQLIDGHLRAETTPDQKVPVLVLDVTEQEAEKLLLTFDPLTAMAEADEPKLRALLESVKFDEILLRQLAEAQIPGYARPGQTDPDEIPEPPKVATTKPGDLYVLGEHRLLCGDSTKPADVERLLARQTPRLMVTDPPYGVAYEVSGKNPRRRKTGRPIANDDLSGGQADFWTSAFKVWPLEGDAYVFSPSGPLISTLCAAVEAAGITHHQWLVWAKHQFILGRSHYHYRHEHIFYGWKGKSSWAGSRTEDSLWEAARPMRSPEHPTMKPVALCRRAIANSSEVGAVVVDQFLGSGTTLIAAEQLERRCFAMEIDPIYCDVIVARWQKFTGRTATLESRPASVSV